jgi:nitroimidazol reductase NimA-like FMN-containing flavoprotein (pyridoxamine 5'-phosphate oxidase superfamily)
MERRLFSLRELSRARCFDLLATLAFGRVGVSVRALPAILPVAYAVAGERVVFRSAPGAKLDAAVHRSVVAFETDRYDPAGAWGWSVLVQGVASEIGGAAELAEARNMLGHDWPFLTEDAVRFVSIEGTFVSGRAFGAVPAR